MYTMHQFKLDHGMSHVNFRNNSNNVMEHLMDCCENNPKNIMEHFIGITRIIKKTH